MKAPVALLVCFLAGCSPDSPAQTSHEITGTQAERVAAVSRIITRNGPLPSALIDAHFLEERTGDGMLGPSDFASFLALTVAPADAGAWRSALPPLQGSQPGYRSPRQPVSWWIAASSFTGLTFHDPKPLTGQLHGWVAIAPDGRIFIHTFTM